MTTVVIGGREFERGAVYRHRRLPGSRLRLMSTVTNSHGHVDMWWTSETTGVTHLCTAEVWLDIAGEKVGT